LRTLLSRAMPLYMVFFLWSLGTGAQQFARPQFAAELGAPIFFVSLIAASNSLAWLIAGPTTGILSDRWGRKPLVIFGNALRGVTTLAQFCANDYVTFFALEFIGGVGVSMWVTGASIVMADITTHENRGRAVAIRSLSAKVGAVLGPLVGAWITLAASLRMVFIFNAVSKVAIHVILVYFVKETRPEGGRGAQRAAGATTTSTEGHVPTLRSRVELLWPLALVTIALSFIGFQGALGALFPSHAMQQAGVSQADIGQLMSLAALAATLSSLVGGSALDRLGRKRPLVLSLVVTAIAIAAFAPATALLPLALAVAAYGLGEGVALGAAEVYSMDMAPQTRRGTFLGNWSLIRNIGGAAGPVLLGAVAQWAGAAAAFVCMGAAVGASALVMAWRGVEPLALQRRDEGRTGQ